MYANNAKIPDVREKCRLLRITTLNIGVSKE
jgi:hypothetical protein